MKLNIRSFALTCALWWGFGLFLLTWWVIAFDGQSEEVNFIGKIYRGYDFTTLGSVIGLAWAFFDGLIGGAIFAFLYNLLAGHCGCNANPQNTQATPT